MDSLVSKFISDYAREVDFYVATARLAEERCKKLLIQNGIRAITSSRAKDAERLEAKLKQRQKDYKNSDDIRQDIVDFAGVRVALYFPGDVTRVTELFRDNFDIKEIKHLGRKEMVTPNGQPNVSKNSEGNAYTAEFAGYGATHFRVTMGTSSLPTETQRYGNSLIEIQVASVIMHAWSEVNHDIAYKTLTGPLSKKELSLLDSLNGIVRTGELTLSQLQDAIQDRIALQGRKFMNVYDLGAYIQKQSGDENKEYLMGDLGVVLKVLRLLSLDNPHSLEPMLAGWRADDKASVTVAFSLMDRLFDTLDRQNLAGAFNPFLAEKSNKAFRTRGLSPDWEFRV